MLDVILKRVACLNNQRYFNLIMGLSLKVREKADCQHDIGAQRATAKYKYTYIAFVKIFNEQFTKTFFEPIDAQIFKILMKSIVYLD